MPHFLNGNTSAEVNVGNITGRRTQKVERNASYAMGIKKSTPLLHAGPLVITPGGGQNLIGTKVRILQLSVQLLSEWYLLGM